MFHIVLFEPQIPPNTGNIIRLCANTGSHLHIIHPCGFQLTDKKLHRAGLDYHEYAILEEHESFDAFTKDVQPPLIYAIETCGKRLYTQTQFEPKDALLFGSETRGLPQWLLQQFPKNQILRIPMRPNIRSINLSNAVSIVTYEAWRQNGFTF
jgi:tRNA (cytidine/uridine-2'-O-)-methyltransferase